MDITNTVNTNFNSLAIVSIVYGSVNITGKISITEDPTSPSVSANFKNL
jgi:hypothetical protein